MDTSHTNFFTTFDVDQEVIDEDGFVRTHPKLLQGNLENLCCGLDRAYLRRDDHLVEGILELFPDDEIAQITPGVGDEPGFIVITERSDVFDQCAVNNIACKEFITDGS